MAPPTPDLSPALPATIRHLGGTMCLRARGGDNVLESEGGTIRHDICQTFYTSRPLTKNFLPESA